MDLLVQPCESYGKELDLRSNFALYPRLTVVHPSEDEFGSVNAGNHGEQVEFPVFWPSPCLSFSH